jgi:hypothetical protein
MVRFNIQRDQIKTISMEGYLEPMPDQTDLDLSIDFNDADLRLVQPFVQENVSELSGNADGQFLVQGSLNTPDVKGKVKLKSGRFKFIYLNTLYDFEGVVSIDNDVIKLEEVVLTDRFDHLAVINGRINTNQYSNIQFDLGLNFESFEFLNTTRKNNSLYYGTAYGTGDGSISGSINDLRIQVTATTVGDTKLYVPVSDEESVSSESFISFERIDLTEEKEADESDFQVSGITLEMDLDVTPAAYMELIFNPRSGDIIRGRANGNLQLNIDTNGEFEMIGGLEVNSGAYNFTTSFINKEFALEPGGSISWFGDPLGATLDLNANYRQLADPKDWDPSYSSPKRPVLVVLSMEGPMMSPEISFDLKLADDVNTSGENEWGRLLTTINNNPEELKRQVFSLLILRKFSPRNSFVVGGIQGGFQSSVSEFVSNQLSYWLNQVDDNLEVDIDLTTLDQDAFNTFQLRLAYTFLDGRLRVARGGGVTTVAEENQSTVANILGDWSVEYLLTEDGRFRAKIFSRNNQIFQNSFEQQTGVSIQYIRSFDDFRELLRKTRQKGLRAAETSPSESSSD